MTKSIFITGHSGFVGKNLSKYFEGIFHFSKYEKGAFIDINNDIVINLAGKAHDLKNQSNPFEYYNVNTELTKTLFDNFLESKASVFITISSVKAVADQIFVPLTEEHKPNPITDYGRSKLLAEKYILGKEIPPGKRVYILRPCMIHGPDNKGNLNTLYKFVRTGLPWPLGSFENKRSFCSIYNFCFIIHELIENYQIPSGVYNIADDESISTNEIINLISDGLGIKSNIWKMPQSLIRLLSKLCDHLNLPINSEKLSKLTETYEVSNEKIKKAINKELPYTTRAGLTITINSFNKNAK